MKEYSEPQMGGYVTDPGYSEMRLRMLLTGTAGPDKEVWFKALTGLLDHLDGKVCPTCRAIYRDTHPSCECVG